MKKKSGGQIGARYGDTLKNFTDVQLSWIGAVAVCYTDAERMLHALGAAVLHLPEDAHQVLSRVNGTDGIIAIIFANSARFSLPDDTREVLKFALKDRGFAHLKTLRDGVIHAQIQDVSSGFAVQYASQGNRYGVALTVNALRWLTHSIRHLTAELRELETALQMGRRLTWGTIADDAHRTRLELGIRSATVLAQEHQRLRLALGPPPELPGPSPGGVLTMEPHREE